MKYLLYFILFITLYFTFNSFVHGSILEYGLFLFFSVGLCQISWDQLHIFKPASATENWIVFRVLQATVLVAGILPVVLHFWKLNHPILSHNNSTVATHSFRSPSDWQDQWETIVQGTGSADEDANALRLNLGDRGAAALKLRRMPLLPSDLPQASFLRPLRLSRQTTDESRLTFNASATRTKPYLGLLFSRRMSIQLVNNGFLVTAPNAKQDVSATFIPLSSENETSPHEWSVLANGGEIRLILDGMEVWKAPQYEPFDQYVLGMPRVDQEHGGTILVQETSVYRKQYITFN
jgi:hypothetical protein